MQIAKVQVGEQERKYSKTRIYVHPQGESLRDNLSNRDTRPHTVYRKEVLPKLFTQLGWNPDTKVKWSQYAGCSCPCSPGFVLDVRGSEVFVDVEAA